MRFLIFLVLLTSCGVVDKISLVGGYGGFDGKIDIVVNEEKTRESGGLVLDQIGEDGDKKTLYTLFPEEIKFALDGIKSMFAESQEESSQKSDYARMINLLGRVKR